MELIVEAIIRGGLTGEDAVGRFLDQLDLTGSPAELFFAEWSEETKTLECVFQTDARNKKRAIRKTAKVVNDALIAIKRWDLVATVQYDVRVPEHYEETVSPTNIVAARSVQTVAAVIAALLYAWA